MIFGNEREEEREVGMELVSYSDSVSASILSVRKTDATYQ